MHNHVLRVTQQPEDWLSVRLSDLTDMGMPRNLSRNQLAEMLGYRYPEKKWGSMYVKYSQQRVLERALHTLFKVRYI